MVEVHAWGGSEAEGYAPIVGAGPIPRCCTTTSSSARSRTENIVVLDVGAQYSGYTADITRTIPANGKFTPRQREIYSIVLGAQNAALAVLKPGNNVARRATIAPIRFPTTTSTRTKRSARQAARQYYIHG